MKHIRNFCIIAHIDHGKSTLADRLLQYTKTISQRDLQSQTLDNMDLERERGITIKSHAIQMEYKYKETNYIMNLIDTPGHVDFSYEVSRAIAACEGTLLVVDATQNIQSQTIANLYLALEHKLEIIPVLNKIDLPSAHPEEVSDEIINLLGCKKENIVYCSGKTGEGILNLLEQIIQRIPHPKGNPNSPLQALIFDSIYNPFRGIQAYFKIINGSISKGEKIKFLSTGKEYFAEEIGILKLNQIPKKKIECGNVGYIIPKIKTTKDIKIGDTITSVINPATSQIEGFEEVKSMLFAGIYPISNENFEDLRSALEKLYLNDSSIVFEPESSKSLGFGFRCGFLGMLHLEIVQERLQREFNINVITTFPSVLYHAFSKKHPNKIIKINNPSELPKSNNLNHIEEPYIKATIITKSKFIGPIINLCINKRGKIIDQYYINSEQIKLIFILPFAEIIFNFYDKLKSISQGYASFDYTKIGMRVSNLVKIDILLNGEIIDALSSIIHFNSAYEFGKQICKKFKNLIPKQQFEIPIQAAIGSKIIAREVIKSVRKDVTAKCYGGDISRKRKLLEKQKEGKKKMRKIGKIEIPQSTFIKILQINNI